MTAHDPTGRSPADAYAEIRRIRRFEERLLDLQQAREVTGSVHLCIGQEAIPVGACWALQDDDPVFATYRGHGWALAKGVPIEQLFGEILGRDSSLNGGRGGSAYLSCPDVSFMGENSIVGAGMPIAIGSALACSRLKPDRVPLAVIGDGAMNQGNVHESLNMASVLGLPIVIVVENNGYVEMTPSDELTAVPAAKRAEAYGIVGRRVDGNDPWHVADAIGKARAESLDTRSPVLIEAMTHRLGGHYSGDAQAYRPPGELDVARLDEPLMRLRSRLDDGEVRRLDAAADADVERAIETARQLAEPSAEGVLEHVYA
jgi:TPP-dependent pyruvate/acetoin dehydrogenase alpha subunit